MQKRSKLPKIIVIALIYTVVLGFMMAGTVFVPVSKAAVNFSGIISSNTTWTKESSPYTLTGNVLVNQNATLTIEPGVTVNLGVYYIKINGTLNARGTNTEKIIFTTANGGSNIDFGTIFFSESSRSWDEQTNSGCIIENAIINCGQDVPALNLFLASPKINKCTITHTSGRSAVYSRGGTAVVSNCTITSNFAGMQIGSYISNNMLVTDNNITHCQVGIEINGGSPLIQRNLISYNMGRTVTGSGGISIVFMQTSPQIRNNTITHNSAGINILGSHSPTISFNNILDNNDYNIFLHNESDALATSNINAANNWWGTTDEAAINRTIYDFKNDFNLGRVTFTPFLDGQVDISQPAPTTTPSPTSTPTPFVTSTPTQTPTPTPTPQTKRPSIITLQPVPATTTLGNLVELTGQVNEADHHLPVTQGTISLTAVDPNGNVLHVGVTQVDSNSHFSFYWTPPIPGPYTVTAKFEGNEILLSSNITATLTLYPPSETPTPSPKTPSPSLTPTHTPTNAPSLTPAFTTPKPSPISQQNPQPQAKFNWFAVAVVVAMGVLVAVLVVVLVAVLRRR